MPVFPLAGQSLMEPIAKRLKQSAESVLHTSRKGEKQEDIAERIKRLEAELQGASNSDSSDSESDDEKPNAVVNLSAYASERIESLPGHLLPASRPVSILPSATTKRKTTQEEENEQAATKALELLTDALTFPQKVPFACKPCKFIGKKMADFQAHRASKEHLEQAQTGEKALHCLLCRKTFTSETQVDEHRAGKWHKQRAQQKKERHIVKICYDFMRGECTWGDRCSFTHTETKAMRSGRASDKTRSQVCDNFVRRENCRFGDKCRFSHNAR